MADLQGPLPDPPKCQRCDSDRVIKYSAKCSDLCTTQFKGKEYEGYVPKVDDDLDWCGDYLEPRICLECGQVQGKFPKPDPDFSGV
jgi:hypothetical protein